MLSLHDIGQDIANIHDRLPVEKTTKASKRRSMMFADWNVSDTGLLTYSEVDRGIHMVFCSPIDPEAINSGLKRGGLRRGRSSNCERSIRQRYFEDLKQRSR